MTTEVINETTTVIDAYQRYDDRNAARRARTRSHNTARREYTS